MPRVEKRQRPDEEAGGDDQDHRQGDLPNDKAPGECHPPASRTPRAIHIADTMLLQRVRWRHAHTAKRRCGAGKHGRRQGHDQREHDNAPVEGQVERHLRHRRGQLGHERPAAPESHDEPDESTADRQYNALREEVPRDPRARRAERKPYLELLLPVQGAREQKVGDVGAGDEEDEAGKDQQREQRSFVLVAESRRARRRRHRQQGLLQEGVAVDLRRVLKRSVGDLRLEGPQERRCGRR